MHASPFLALLAVLCTARGAWAYPGLESVLCFMLAAALWVGAAISVLYYLGNRLR